MRLDPHSYYDSDQPLVRHLDLDWEVDFERRRLAGRVTLTLARAGSGPLDLDTKGLVIRAVRTPEGRAIGYRLADEEPILGRRLALDLPRDTSRVVVEYETGPDAVALQWLAPEQTAGRRHPFLFSQCQPIHARTMVPLQDSPRVRTTYHAAVTVPAELGVVMSAGPSGEQRGAGGELRASGRRTLLFDMPQPIPSYLIALAVGNLASRDLSGRSRVWAEPETVDAAAWEFEGVEQMIVTAEGLFGPYEWDRYDMLVLPPAFPYGGMENPRMTFLTPTLLASDRSLVDVVAHELAHSWTGNLVTNATIDHFWLNEGFTVWAERRILEALRGPEAAALGWALGRTALEESVKRFGADSPYTVLRTDLAGVDPDDVYSSIPYEKGSRFVLALEESVGRARWDAFMRRYIAHFRFTSITTEEFLAFLESELPGAASRVDAQAWLTRPGLPAVSPVHRSATLEAISALARRWPEGARPSREQIAAWGPNELLLYLQRLPRRLDAASCGWLDRTLALTGRGNYELLVEWLTVAAGSDYEPVFGRIRDVLTRVGRMKYLRPLFTAMGMGPRTRALAREIYAAASPGWHVLSRKVVEQVMEGYEST